MKKILLIVFLMQIFCSIAIAQEVPPFKLTIKPDKEVYFEGDEIKIFYIIENVSDESVGFYEGGLITQVLNSDGTKLEQYNGGIRAQLVLH